MIRRARDEQGAVALMTAMLVVIILIIAALAVDLGNAFVHKRERQKDADFATLAGAGVAGANLPGPTPGGTCAYGNRASAGDQGVKDVAAYLNKQLAPTTVSAATLVNCDVDDGEVFYGLPKQSAAGAWSLTYNKNQLSLVSPPDQVDFGFANVIGISNVKVAGVSTVEIRSPKLSVLPFYAFTGCDYGPQTLQEPNNGQSADPVLLFAGSDTNNATMPPPGVSPVYYPAGTANGTLQPIDITGVNLTGVTDVGFFESGNATTGPAPVSANATGTPFTINAAGTQIHFNDLPDATRGVTGVQTYWYIRVYKGGQWSTVYTGNGSNLVLNAPRLTIGSPPLTCGQGSSSGNFGTIKLSHPPFNGADDEGAANVALGLISDLDIYPQSARLPDGTCSTAQTATKLWPTSGTNCVDTDTGMSAKVASGGFLGIGSSAPNSFGLLGKPFTTKCGPGGTSATSVRLTRTINNDTLTCFFTNASTNVGAIDNAAYSGPVVLSSAIYDSPRFGYVPVLPTQPTSGGSAKYQIIEFRACFITDQPASAVRGDPPSLTNGVITDTNGVKSVQVIFINLAALPSPPATNGTNPFNGTGLKIPLLVN